MMRRSLLPGGDLDQPLSSSSNRVSLGAGAIHNNPSTTKKRGKNEISQNHYQEESKGVSPKIDSNRSVTHARRSAVSGEGAQQNPQTAAAASSYQKMLIKQNQQHMMALAANQAAASHQKKVAKAAKGRKPQPTDEEEEEEDYGNEDEMMLEDDDDASD